MKLVTCSTINKMFVEADSNTIIRRRNLRQFTAENNIRHIVTQRRWLIDAEDFLQNVNPKGINESAPMPKLRCLHACVEMIKSNCGVDIDKHDIERAIVSGNVSAYRYGNKWILNYDEVEQQVLRQLKNCPRKKIKKEGSDD